MTKPLTCRIGTYPQHVEYRGGCKVAWLVYKDEADAEVAASIAEQEADRLSREGYDFGFCSPGSISRDDETGAYIVCIP